MDWNAMLKGWRGAVFASLVAALLLFAINAPPNHETGIGTQDQGVSVNTPISTDERIANYTEALAIFTVVLALASIWQGWLTNRSLNLARDEFHATHRPKLVLRFAKITGTGPTTAVTLTIANIGEGDGKILGISGELGWREKDDTKWSPESLNLKLEDIFLLKGPTLPSGDRRELVHISQFQSREEDQFGFRSAFSDLFFAGEVRYIDNAKIVRHTGFIRVSNDGGPLMRTKEFPDYEYQD